MGAPTAIVFDGDDDEVVVVVKPPKMVQPGCDGDDEGRDLGHVMSRLRG